MSQNYEQLNESGLSRIWQHWKNHDTGIIAASRFARQCGLGEPISSKENEKRTQKLRAQLQKIGYGVTSIKGSFIENYGSENEREVGEKSFFVVDINDTGNLKKDMMELGQKYQQDCIAYADAAGSYYLISTNQCEDAYPGQGKVGVEMKIGNPYFGKEGEFFSRVGGRPFVFESVEKEHITLDRINVMGRWALVCEAEQELESLQ